VREELAHLVRELVEVVTLHHAFALVGQLELRLPVHGDVVELAQEEEVAVELQRDGGLEQGLHVRQLVGPAQPPVLLEVLQDEEGFTADRLPADPLRLCHAAGGYSRTLNRSAGSASPSPSHRRTSPAFA